MEAIARMRLGVNVVGLVGATTNMPSGTAVKPGDVVQASNGRFIEIINTDAEGRLVLADVLAYAKRFKPAAAIDAATLTGACVIALGHTATGVMGNDNALVAEVLAASMRAGEPGWQLPMWDDFKELIRSDVADVKNSGGRPAGTITAALFLQEFVDGYPWVHLDIAGTAYTESDLVTLPRGPTGVPVGSFVEVVRARASCCSFAGSPRSSASASWPGPFCTRHCTRRTPRERVATRQSSSRSRRRPIRSCAATASRGWSARRT